MKLIAEGNELLSRLTTGKNRSVEKEQVKKTQIMLDKCTVINKKIDKLKSEIKTLTS